jgi:hypothetical protein
LLYTKEIPHPAFEYLGKVDQFKVGDAPQAALDLSDTGGLARNARGLAHHAGALERLARALARDARVSARCAGGVERRARGLKRQSQTLHAIRNR